MASRASLIADLACVRAARLRTDRRLLLRMRLMADLILANVFLQLSVRDNGAEVYTNSMDLSNAR